GPAPADGRTSPRPRTPPRPHRRPRVPPAPAPPSASTLRPDHSSTDHNPHRRHGRATTTSLLDACLFPFVLSPRPSAPGGYSRGRYASRVVPSSLNADRRSSTRTHRPSLQALSSPHDHQARRRRPGPDPNRLARQPAHVLLRQLLRPRAHQLPDPAGGQRRPRR